MKAFDQKRNAHMWSARMMKREGYPALVVWHVRKARTFNTATIRVRKGQPVP